MSSAPLTPAARLWRGILLGLVIAVLVVHVGAGWMFSGQIVDDAFTPPEGLAFGDPAATALPISEIEYVSSVGAIDAWHLDGTRSEWVIHIHGKGASLEQALPVAESLAGAGYNQLIIGYRNDVGQPPDPSGYYRYGATEHEDVAAAVEWAREKGADQVALFGYSTGGAIALSYLYKNPNAPVRSMVLDSPNADMGATVDLAASQETLLGILPVPFTITELAKTLASLRVSVNWQSIDYVRRIDGLSVPTLVFHGTEDTRVPIETSQQMAADRPQVVELIVVEGAGHVSSRDISPAAYDQRILDFLADHWR